VAIHEERAMNGDRVGWRAIATLGIVVATMVAFTLVNEFFGASLANGATVASGAGGRG